MEPVGGAVITPHTDLVLQKKASFMFGHGHFARVSVLSGGRQQVSLSWLLGEPVKLLSH